MKGFRALLFCGFFILFLGSCKIFVPKPEILYARSLEKHPKYDAIIVPGVPFVEPNWDMVMQMRCIWATHLYKRGLTNNIITSGGSVYSPYVEAEIMKRYIVAMGVPEEHVFVEARAEHSTENIWYSTKLAKSKGFSTIALATDEFQTKMTYRFVKRRTKEVQWLPVITDTLRTLDHTQPIIKYKDLKLEKFVALPDRENIFQRLRGTKGKHIKYKEK